ncbi:MAG: LPS export ABC transporter periplasmic protein LptC [Oligoflexia bacterium]|nr:LPS export ABC transporter periplasmic protein LptC [Oligoflexia bacterium]
MFRRFLIAAISILTMVQIVMLSPSSVDEEQDGGSIAADPEHFIPKGDQPLATGIPQGQVPDYSVDKFNYVSTQDGVKQWKLVAETAFLYNQEKLVHARNVKAYLYDSDGKITVVIGLEAKYFMNERDLEIFGNVHTTFPDGFVLRSPYLRHRPQARKIEIPARYPVQGDGSATENQKMEFDSYGMDFDMAQSRITLDRAVQVRTLSPGSERTTIDSDRCVIFRARRTAHFTMSAERPLERRFVRIRQPSLFAQSRRSDLNYGEGDAAKRLNHLIAYEDVLIRELPAPVKPEPKPSASPLKYATGGKAVFDAQRNVIVLTEYPQVYQDNDTVTGEVIVLHRDKDIVEVEHSNAYSQGN